MALIHKEGFPTLIIAFLLVSVFNLVTFMFYPGLQIFSLFLSVIILIFFLQFFRNPGRKIPQTSGDLIYAPADGKVVVVEKTTEKEFFGDERIQVSIFMSPFNVHVNRSPVHGNIKFYKYHPGKYLVAWHPKSSEENERTTIVVESSKGSILMRQIAGFVARRIIFYPEQGDEVEQGQEIGFIKFGSRVDLFLPLNAEILVSPGEKVKGAKTIIARL